MAVSSKEVVLAALALQSCLNYETDNILASTYIEKSNRYTAVTSAIAPLQGELFVQHTALVLHSKIVGLCSKVYPDIKSMRLHVTVIRPKPKYFPTLNVTV